MKKAILFTVILALCISVANAGSNYTPTYSSPCLACAVPGGLSVGNLTGNTATLLWDAVPGATAYTIEVEDEQNVPSTFHIEVNVSGNSYNASGLQQGVTYKFKVRARCGGDKSNWSSWYFFNDNGGSSGNGGSCLKPINLKTLNVSANGAVLQWDAVAGANAYTLEIERDKKGATPWKLVQIVPTNSFTLSALNPNTRYKFKVRTNCNLGHSDWSGWVKFKTLNALMQNGQDDALAGHKSFQLAPSIATTDRSQNGIEAAEEAFSLKVWPNPAQSHVMIQLNGSSHADLQLYSLSGRLLLERKTNEALSTLQVSELENGLYLLRVSSGQTTQTLKLVVKKPF